MSEPIGDNSQRRSPRRGGAAPGAAAGSAEPSATLLSGAAKETGKSAEDARKLERDREQWQVVMKKQAQAQHKQRRE